MHDSAITEVLKCWWDDSKAFFHISQQWTPYLIKFSHHWFPFSQRISCGWDGHHPFWFQFLPGQMTSCWEVGCRAAPLQFHTIAELSQLSTGQPGIQLWTLQPFKVNLPWSDLVGLSGSCLHLLFGRLVFVFICWCLFSSALWLAECGTDQEVTKKPGVFFSPCSICTCEVVELAAQVSWRRCQYLTLFINFNSKCHLSKSVPSFRTAIIGLLPSRMQDEGSVTVHAGIPVRTQGRWRQACIVGNISYILTNDRRFVNNTALCCSRERDWTGYKNWIFTTTP